MAPVARGSLLVALLTVASRPAAAGVEYTGDIEAAGLGQGGAFIAAPDTLAAVWYNPAGLVQQRGLNIEIEGGLIASPLSYDLASPTSGHVENQSQFLPTGLAGVTYDFGRPDLVIGLFAYVPSSSHYQFDPDGPQRFQAVGGRYRLAFFHAAAAVRVRPDLSLGMRYAFRPGLSVELASVFEGWSRLKDVELTPHITVSAPALGIASQALPALSLVKNYRNVVSLRLGAEWSALEWLTVRAGTLFESAGSSTEYFDLTAPEANKYGATLGASVRFGRFFIDLAYAHFFIPSVTVSDSADHVDNVLAPGDTEVIGNGVYRFSFDFFHIGLRMQFFPG